MRIEADSKYIELSDSMRQLRTSASYEEAGFWHEFFRGVGQTAKMEFELENWKQVTGALWYTAMFLLTVTATAYLLIEVIWALMGQEPLPVDIGTALYCDAETGTCIESTNDICELAAQAQMELDYCTMSREEWLKAHEWGVTP